MIFIHSAKLFSTLKNSPFPLAQGIKLRARTLDLILCLIPCHRCEKSAREFRQTHHFDQPTWQHPRESHRHVRGSARKYDVRMAQFVLKIKKLSHIIGAHYLLYMYSKLVSHMDISLFGIAYHNIALFLSFLRRFFLWHSRLCEQQLQEMSKWFFCGFWQSTWKVSFGLQDMSFW